MSEAPRRVWIQFDEFPTGEDAWRALPDPDAAGLDPLYVSAAALRELCERFRRPAFLKIADSLQAPASTAILTFVVELEKLLEGKD